MKKMTIINPIYIFSVLCFIILIYVISNNDLSFLETLICSSALAFSIYSSVYNAEVIAKRIGPSLGALLLALAVTVIEVGLIVSIMNAGGVGASTIARDTVFATIMIVTNGIIGICLIVGGLRHRELGFQPQGTSSLIGILSVLSAVTLVLPNFTTSSIGPTYSDYQLTFVSVISLVAYGVITWAQTISHRTYFQAMTDDQFKKLETFNYVPSRAKSILSFACMIVSLLCVVGLAKVLSPSISEGIRAIGAPHATVGIIIALLVLAPETFAAINAAKNNQLQTSLNLALGSGAASIALTIPAVSIFILISGGELVLGLDPKSTAFLMLTFIASGLTFATGKTTVLQGVVHLMILVSYIALSFMP